MSVAVVGNMPERVAHHAPDTARLSPPDFACRQERHTPLTQKLKGQVRAPCNTFDHYARTAGCRRDWNWL